MRRLGQSFLDRRETPCCHRAQAGGTLPMVCDRRAAFFYPSMKFIIAFYRRAVARRHGGVILFITLFLGVGLLTRLALLVKAGAMASFNASLLAAFAWGAVYDFGASLLFAIPLTLLITLLPRGF